MGIDNDKECIYTIYRKVEKGCVCDDKCEYRINSEKHHNCSLEFAAERKSYIG